ncbi:MAG TPA: hypothetical protein VK137_08320, partial [Planctomycetaceae bacterium]|nr:hypothetical protein [Planctomycetaceae bacterium]
EVLNPQGALLCTQAEMTHRDVTRSVSEGDRIAGLPGESGRASVRPRSRFGLMRADAERGNEGADECVLCVGYEGAECETNWQVETLLGECRPFEPRSAQTLIGPAADPLWAALTDFPIVDSSLSFKASLLPSRTIEFLQLASDAGIAVQAHAGDGIVFGHLPSDVSSAAQTEDVLRPFRQHADSYGGHLIVLRGPVEAASSQPRWQELGPASDWMRRVKQQLDPLNLLCPGHVPA